MCQPNQILGVFICDMSKKVWQTNDPKMIQNDPTKWRNMVKAPTLERSNLATALALLTKFFSAKLRQARLKCCITRPAWMAHVTFGNFMGNLGKCQRFCLDEQNFKTEKKKTKVSTLSTFFCHANGETRRVSETASGRFVELRALFALSR